MRVVYINTLILVTYCTFSYAAGVGSHLTFLLRVISDPSVFEETQLNINSQYYFPWLKSGAFFPDALYSCSLNNKKWHDFAEYTHWSPFLELAINYWRDTYGDKKNGIMSEESQKLAAFLLGIFTHQVVDVPWHALGEGYRDHGLLKVLAELEFNSDLNKAHSYLDIIGDFLIMADMLEGVDNEADNLIWKFFNSLDWALPSPSDISALVSLSGFSEVDINYRDIEKCVTRGMTALNSEVRLIATDKLPYLLLAYNSSPRARELIKYNKVGGEFDLILTLKRKVKGFLRKFENNEMVSYLGDGDTGYDSIDIIERSMPNRVVPLHSKSFGSFKKYWIGRKDSHLGENMLFVKLNDTKFYLISCSSFTDRYGQVYIIPICKDNKQLIYDSTISPVLKIKGSSIGKIEISYNDSHALIVIDSFSRVIKIYHSASEHYSYQIDDCDMNNLKIVSIIYDRSTDMNTIFLADKLYGKNEKGKVISFEIDGSGRPIKNTGTGKVLLQTVMDPSTFKLGNYVHTASSVLISGKSMYIAAAGAGVVMRCHVSAVPLSEDSCSIVNVPNNPENSDISEIVPLPSRIHGDFGKTLLSIFHQDEIYILISQPLHNFVHVYKEIFGNLRYLTKLTVPIRLDEIPQLVGFGTSMVFDRVEGVLHIASPGINGGKGAIWTVSFSEIVEAAHRNTIELNPNNHVKYTNPLSSIHARSFGFSLAWCDEGQLAVGVPEFGYNSIGLEEVAGAILIY
ncbi:Uncharacterized protein AO441_003967 [Nakaseomyces glabratus]|uniref:Phospholipase C/D domain-containing protein n=1 Tax=Candida glabrata TaxID=5478 RepID=A0A0W0CN20_CANGB|nr:Uncharacterized protein AO440_005017 [Nakaseomyces glabratus]KTB04871.1 Uncharacterized protein AO440_004908 [Nakaseomyces glabratus]KTB06955.1 Uncharacterized protein AO441_003967 [Nakaseomyces glabratus]KTB08671.1 Uncharacterized protein AO439_004098 [Nakaseomyces glabratus]KTB19130.1 Uncharacterized protein AO438_004123 [Nakaseomyces glabratus]